MWCWSRMEKISWTDHVRNEEVLLRVNEQRNILHEISKWKANWIGYILRRNCLLQRVIEGKMKGHMCYMLTHIQYVPYLHFRGKFRRVKRETSPSKGTMPFRHRHMPYTECCKVVLCCKTASILYTEF